MPLDDVYSDPRALIGMGLLSKPNIGEAMATGMGLLSQAKQQKREEELFNYQMKDIERKQAQADERTQIIRSLLPQLGMGGQPQASEPQTGGAFPDMPRPSAPRIDPAQLAIMGALSGDDSLMKLGEFMQKGDKQDEVRRNVEQSVTTDEMKNLNESATGARKRLELLNQAERSLRGLDTGTGTSIISRYIAAPLEEFTGINVMGGKKKAQQVQAAEAAINPIAKTFRVSGEGSSSDRDVQLLLASAPSVNNEPEANKTIIAAQRAQSQREVDYADTVQSLYNQGYSLPEAKQIYKEYAEANPIFAGDALEDGINANAIMSFAEWIAVGKPNNAGGKPKAAQSADFNSMSDKDLMREYGITEEDLR